MDQISQLDLYPLIQISQVQLSKKAIQILLSVSLFSFLFSYSSLIPFLLHSFNTFSILLFSYTADKAYIFLFCNGILVFLIKNSGLISNPPLGTDTNNEHTNENGVPELLVMKVLATEEVAVEVEEEQERDNGNLVAVVDGESGLQMTEDEYEQEDEFFIIEEEEEEGIGLLSLSAEELNRKCDDFIKMMKEGIKIEAQQ